MNYFFSILTILTYKQILRKLVVFFKYKWFYMIYTVAVLNKVTVLVYYMIFN